MKIAGLLFVILVSLAAGQFVMGTVFSPEMIQKFSDHPAKEMLWGYIGIFAIIGLVLLFRSDIVSYAGSDGNMK